MHVQSYCTSSSCIAVSIEAGSASCRRHNFLIFICGPESRRRRDLSADYILTCAPKLESDVSVCVLELYKFKANRTYTAGVGTLYAAGLFASGK